MGPTRRLNAEELTERKKTALLEKDAIELKLEKALFGDQDGFLASLYQEADAADRQISFAPGQDYDNASESEPQDEEMQDVADENLFFLDAGTELDPDIADDLRQQQLERTEELDDSHSRRIPLWHDSDDDRITVSLVNNKRLRKLRETEDDDLVTGTEYIRRLRRQYERIHPPPEWVKYARRRRRLAETVDGADSDSDVSIDEIPSQTVSLSELLRSSRQLTRQQPTSTSRQQKLRPDMIDIARLKDVASSGPSAVDIVQFHPFYPLLLTAGPSSTITLYHVSPHSPAANPEVTAIHVKGTPITSAAFNCIDSDDTKLYLSARRRYFHTYSLANASLQRISRPLLTSTTSATQSLSKPGKALLPTCEHLILSPTHDYLGIITNSGQTTGTLHLLSTATHQPIASVLINGLNGIAHAVFYRDGSGATILSKAGELTEYNITQGRVITRWHDVGGVGSTTVALGGELGTSITSNKRTEAGLMGTDKWVAIGSSSGVVSIYDRAMIVKMHVDGAPMRPQPVRTLENLTTPVSSLTFSKLGDLLVMSSRWKKDALRLVHLPSCTVYKNWPTSQTPLGRVTSQAFSPDGGLLVVANEKGAVRMWQIRD